MPPVKWSFPFLTVAALLFLPHQDAGAEAPPGKLLRLEIRHNAPSSGLGMLTGGGVGGLSVVVVRSPSLDDLKRNRTTIHMPNENLRDLVNARTATSYDEWKDSLRKAVEGGVQLEVANYGGMYAVEVTPEAAWFLANKGTEEDRRFVAERFPSYPDSIAYQEKMDKEKREADAARQRAEQERKQMLAQLSQEIDAGVEKNDFEAIVMAVRRAPDGALDATGLDALKKVLAHLAVNAGSGGWVAAGQPTNVLHKPSGGSTTAFELPDDDPVYEIGRKDKYSLVAWTGKHSVDAAALKSLDAVWPHTQKIGWVQTSMMVSWTVREKEIQHDLQTHEKIEATDFSDLVTAFADLTIALEYHRKTKNRVDAYNTEIKLNQARELLCRSQKKLLNDVSRAELMSAVREFCEQHETDAEQQGALLEIPAARCIKLYTRLKCR